jgi:hypothetical protein
MSDGEQKVDGSARVHTPAASHQFGDVLVRKRIAGTNAYKNDEFSWVLPAL